MNYTEFKQSYNAALLERWKNKEVELDVDALRSLLYGFTFTAEYAEGNFPDALSMDYWRDKYSDNDDNTDYMPLANTGDIDDFDNISLDNVDMYEVDAPQERLLMQVLDSTGDGKTPETAISVIDVGQEYEYLERKFPFNHLSVKEQRLSQGVDCLCFSDNIYGIECIYFDVSRKLEVNVQRYSSES